MKSRRSILFAILLLGATSCGGLPDVPGRPGGGGGSDVSPNACGNYAEVDIGRRVKAFLNATVGLQKSVFEAEGAVNQACAEMGEILGVEKSKLKGKTDAVCAAVSAELKSTLSAGLKGRARAKLVYEPPVCTVKADIAAKASAECEGSASADVEVQCSGTCEGTCNGQCDGTCAAGSGAECNGSCDGTCRGSCSGTCSGTAEVKGDATCKASAEAKANVDAKCSKPEVSLEFDASLVADSTKMDLAVKAIKKGMPRLLVAHAKLTGPAKNSIRLWAKTAKRLAAAGSAKFKALGANAVCVSGQISAAVAGVVDVNASVSVSVSASASVGGAAGGNL